MPRALIASLLLGGCTLALSYPGATEREICGNVPAADDDLDGRFDCDDPDCDGECPEQDMVRCTDGRDNDGDGRRDQEDVLCWPLVHPNVERCESIGPSTWAGNFDALGDGWTLAQGTAMIEPDPRDAARTVGHVFGTPDDRGQMLGPVFAGSLDGARFDFEMEVGSEQSGVGILVAGADLRVDDPDGLLAFTNRGQVGLAGSSSAVVLFAEDARARRWMTGALTFHYAPGSAPTFDVAIDGQSFGLAEFTAPMSPFASHWFPGSRPGEVPRALTEGRAVQPFFATEGEARLGRYHLTLGRLDPCRTQPTASVPDPPQVPVPQFQETIVGLAARGSLVCALAWAPPSAVGQPTQLLARRSLDGGHTFLPDSVVVATSTAFSVGTAPMLVEPSGFSALVSWYVSAPASIVDAAQIDLVRSADCITWTRDDIGLPTFAHTYARGMGYSIGADGYEIALTLYGSTGVSGTAQLVLATSPTGEPGSYEFVDTGGIPFPPDLVFRDGSARLDVLRLGADRAIVYASGRGIDAFVQTSPGEWTPVAEPLVTPSGQVGTFDAFLVTSPVVAFASVAPRDQPPSMTGVIGFVPAARCDTGSSCTTPSAVAQIELRAP